MMIAWKISTHLTITVLLVTALDTRLVVIFVHAVVVEIWSPPGLGLCEDNLFDDGVLGNLVHGLPGREGLFEVVDESGIDVLWELDGEFDVEVSRFVMTQRGHTLTMNDLEIAYSDTISTLSLNKR